MKTLKGIAILFYLTLSLNIFAAEQGDLVHGGRDIQSSGNLDITLEIAHAIQINELDDINLGQFKSGLDSNKTGFDEFCVFTNAESFSLNILGQNPNVGNPSGFAMQHSTNNQEYIPYNVYLATLSKEGNRSHYQAIFHNNETKNITEVRNQLNCEGENNEGFKPNLEIKVDVAERDLLDSIPGAYKDTLTLIASPE